MRLFSLDLPLALTVAAFGATAVTAQEEADAPAVDFGPRTGYVQDLAGVVDADSRNAIEDMASEVRRKSKGDIVVVTLPSLGGRTPEDLAAELTELWNVGFRGAADDPATDTGVLVLLSLQERDFSVQVQDGVEKFFPNAAIRDVVMSRVIEPFRAGDYGLGLTEAVRGIANVFAQHFQFELESGQAGG